METDSTILPCGKTEDNVKLFDVHYNLTDGGSKSYSEGSTSDESSTDDYIPQEQESDLENLLNGNIREKIKHWILRNLSTLTQKAIDEILIVLRSEGYISLPKSCKTLLGTSSITCDEKIIKSSDDTLGKFKYFGIRPSLDAIICPSRYLENGINLIVHVDGMDIYNKSKKGFWSIMGKVFGISYVTRPFLIGLYFGNSKPFSAREFLSDLISEANELTKEGSYLYEQIISFIKCFF